MLELIMVPLDTSTFAEQALPHAVVLARRAQAKLQLVSVRASVPLDLVGEREEAYLAKIAAQLEPELPGAITHRVVTDEFTPLYPPPDTNTVADVLSRYAREQHADLIVMATHGLGGVRRAWLGSVADSLIRIASRPVLLVRPPDESFGAAISADRGIRHIVIPLDGSDTAEQVIPHALQLGSPFGARYSLVRVISPVAWGGYEPLSIPAPPLTRLDVADYLVNVALPMREQGADVTMRVLEAFAPAPAITEYAEAHAADAIALSTAGAGRVRRLLLGSVTDKIVRSSEVPVLVCNIRRLEPIGEPKHETTAAVATVSSERAGRA